MFARVHFALWHKYHPSISTWAAGWQSFAHSCFHQCTSLVLSPIQCSHNTYFLFAFVHQQTRALVAVVKLPISFLKPETYRANRWPSEVFGETRTSLGTNLFGLFSCIGSFWDCVDSVCSDLVWEHWLFAVWAIGYSDWLCASCMTIVIGSVLVNQCGGRGGILCARWTLRCALCFSMHCVLSFPVLMFWITGMRLALPNLAQVQNVHTTVWFAAVEVVFNATLLPNGSDERQQSDWTKAVGCWFESGRCVGALMHMLPLLGLMAVMTHVRYQMGMG